MTISETGPSIHEIASRKDELTPLVLDELEMECAIAACAFESLTATHSPDANMYNTATYEQLSPSLRDAASCLCYYHQNVTSLIFELRHTDTESTSIRLAQDLEYISDSPLGDSMSVQKDTLDCAILRAKQKLEEQSRP